MKHRVWRAAGIMVFLVGAVCCIDLYKPLIDPVLGRDVALVAQSLRNTTGEKGRSSSANAALNSVFEESAAMGEYADRLPDGFEDEVLSPAGFDEVVVSADGSVVGFVGEGEGIETFNRLANELILRGWTEIESNQEMMASFAKKAGVYTWALLTCSPVGAQVGVVIQIR